MSRCEWCASTPPMDAMWGMWVGKGTAPASSVRCGPSRRIEATPCTSTTTARGRCSIFGPDLGYVRQFTNPGMMSNYWIRQALPDGRFVLITPGNVRRITTPGLHPDSTRIVIMSADGEASDTVGTFETRKDLVQANGRPQNVYLAPYATFHTGAGRMAWSEGGALEYSLADDDGAVRQAGPDSQHAPGRDAGLDRGVQVLVPRLAGRPADRGVAGPDG